MPFPSLRPDTRGRRAAALASIIVGGALIMPADAAPDVEPVTPKQLAVPSDAAAQGYPDLPGANDLPSPGSISAAEGTVTNSQGVVASRSKMYITVGPDAPIWGALFFGEFNTPLDDPTGYLPSCLPGGHGAPCVPDPFYQPACATDDPATQSEAAYWRSPLLPLSPLEGGGADVGLVAEVPVNLVAFGSIPATATLTMRAPRVNGEVQPLMANIWDRNQGSAGCGPLPPGAPAVSALIDGQVEIRLSGLTVDGTPVDLGQRCRTVRPADLWLWGETTRGGYFPGSGGNIGAYDGLHPGSQLPLNHRLYFGRYDGKTIPPSDGVDVPRFVGCGTGGENLSPLVTAMASGPDNPVRVVQSPIIPIGRIPLEDFTQCDPFRPEVCPLPGPEAPEMPPLPWEKGS
jgi:hypothetical protein